MNKLAKGLKQKVLGHEVFAKEQGGGSGQYSKITWGPAVAVLGMVMIYVLAQIVAFAVFATYFKTKGWSSAQITDWLDGSVWAQFWFVLTLSTTTLGLTVWVLRLFKSSLKLIGLKRPKWADLGWAFTGYTVYFLTLLLVLGIVFALFPGLDNGQTQDTGFATTAGGVVLVLVFASLVILPAIIEEILFRGFLFCGLRTKLTFLPAALITSLMFGVVHLQFGGSGPLLWAAAIDTFILSMVMLRMREKTGSLWSSIGLHGLKNSLAFLALFVF